jgi:SAM-dependent methyltransferase
LSAIGVLYESGLAETLREPRTLDELAAGGVLARGRVERCLGVAAVAGLVVVEDRRYRLAPGALPFVAPGMRASLLGEIRSVLMQPLAFLDRAKDPAQGWNHTDPMLLQAQGDWSGMFPMLLKREILPKLGDLAARLEGPDPRFLDVGVGVASLAIATCNAWPNLRVVGLDVSDAPLTIARANVARAGMADRIELRKVAVQDFRDEGAFDLAWLPAFFIAPATLPAALRRVHASLRPGGWLLFPSGTADTDARERAISALIYELWGGPCLTGGEAVALLTEAGFTDVRALPGPPGAAPLVAGTR